MARTKVFLFLSVLLAGCAPHFSQIKKGDVSGVVAFWSSHEQGIVLARVDGSFRKKINKECRSPLFFPDSKRLLCSDWSTDEKYILDLDGKLMGTYHFNAWPSDISPHGDLVVGNDNSKNVVIYDLALGSVVTRITPGDIKPGAYDLIHPHYSRRENGILYLIVEDHPDKGPWHFYRYDLLNQTAAEFFQFPSSERWIPTDFSIDPSGKRLVFSEIMFPVRGPATSSHLFTVDIDGANRTQITFGKGRFYGNPQWSPDGTVLLAEDNTQGHKLEGEAAVLLIMNPDGSNQRRIFPRTGLFFESNDANARWQP